VRYRGAAGGAEKAHSRQRRWCLWSKSVNLWGRGDSCQAPYRWHMPLQSSGMAGHSGTHSRKRFQMWVHFRSDPFFTYFILEQLSRSSVHLRLYTGR